MAYKEDLRIVRTRKLLSDTLLEMMEHESIEKISVIDLCQKALVNRATFYAHFEDKYHLLNFALDELKDELYSNFNCDFEVVSPREMIRKLAHMALAFVTDNKNHVSNILKCNHNEKVIQTIKESMYSSVKYQLSKYRSDIEANAPVNLVALCFSSALTDLCIWYVENPDKYTYEAFSAHIDALINTIKS